MCGVLCGLCIFGPLFGAYLTVPGVWCLFVGAHAQGVWCAHCAWCLVVGACLTVPGVWCGKSGGDFITIGRSDTCVLLLNMMMTIMHHLFV